MQARSQDLNCGSLNCTFWITHPTKQKYRQLGALSKREHDFRNIHTYLCSSIIHDLFGGQITFVAYQQLIHGFASISIDFLEPLFDVIKGFLVCHVIYNNNSVCASVIAEIGNNKIIIILCCSTTNTKFLKYFQKKNNLVEYVIYYV